MVGCFRHHQNGTHHINVSEYVLDTEGNVCPPFFSPFLQENDEKPADLEGQDPLWETKAIQDGSSRQPHGLRSCGRFEQKAARTWCQPVAGNTHESFESFVLVGSHFFSDTQKKMKVYRWGDMRKMHRRHFEGCFDPEWTLDLIYPSTHVNRLASAELLSFDFCKLLHEVSLWSWDSCLGKRSLVL